MLLSNRVSGNSPKKLTPHLTLPNPLVRLCLCLNMRLQCACPRVPTPPPSSTLSPRASAADKRHGHRNAHTHTHTHTHTQVSSTLQPRTTTCATRCGRSWSSSRVLTRTSCHGCTWCALAPSLASPPPSPNSSRYNFFSSATTCSEHNLYPASHPPSPN